MHSRLHGEYQPWLPPDHSNTAANPDATAAPSSSNPVIVQSTRPVANIEPRPQPISPEVLMYEPFTNVRTTSNVDTSNIRDNTATGSVPFQSSNSSSANLHAPRHQSASRCPYYRRVYHNLPSHYHSTLQNSNAYMRPAYAPHESLWYRQQNNQEIHRRHMMNTMSGSAVSNDAAPSNSFSSYPSRGSSSMSNNAYCVQCDQQHPIGHPHRRVRQYVCGLNFVRF